MPHSGSSCATSTLGGTHATLKMKRVAWDLAAWAGTTSWEILTSVGSRVPRVYVQGGRVVHVESRYKP